MRWRPFLLVISLLNLRYALLVSHLVFEILGKWCDPEGGGDVKTTQEGDHVNVITQIIHETNMKFQ